MPARDDDTPPGALVRKRDGSSRALAAPNLDFSDHATFHETVGRAVGGGAVGAILAELAQALTDGGFGPALFAIAVTTGALAMVAGRGKRWLKALIGGSLGAVGSAAFLASEHYVLFAPLLLGAAAAPVLASGESWKRMSVTALTAGTFGFAGLFVARWMLDVGLLSGMVPGPIATAAAGAAAGLFFGLAAAPRHVARPADPVEAAYLEALAIKDGELFEILARALSIHRAVKGELEQRREEHTVQKLGARVGELALRILRIADQCRRIERDLAAAPAYELEERIESLRRKADSATDEHARATYNSAVQSLDGQRRAFDAVNRGRERVIARLHANVALLEKVRFSLLHLRSADAERSGGEASPLLEALEELSREIDVTSTAVGEVFGKGGAEPRALAASNEGASLLPLAAEAGAAPREGAERRPPRAEAVGPAGAGLSVVRGPEGDGLEDTLPPAGVKDRRGLG